MGDPLALVHDYLTQRGGAERVVATWCRAFPDAPLYTSLYAPALTFEEFGHHRVLTSPLNALAPLRRHHRYALPVLAPVMSRWRVEADVVLASSSGWAHGVRASGPMVVYCHAPARWLYQRERYLRAGALGRHAEFAVRALEAPLRAWDARAAHRAHAYLANSRFTRDLVRTIYGIDAPVVPPPVEIPAAPPESAVPTDVLVVARLLAYKNLDLVLAVARHAPDLSFSVVGDGPLRAALERAKGPNVTFVGAVSEDELWRRYAGARVLLSLSHEDFGIATLEAAGVGVPAVARASGGYLDTVTEETGVLVPEDAITADRVVSELRAALARPWDADALRRHARAFAPDAHVARITEAIGSASRP